MPLGTCACQRRRLTAANGRVAPCAHHLTLSPRDISCAPRRRERVSAGVMEGLAPSNKTWRVGQGAKEVDPV
jgi:hypothetical protein